MQFNSIQTYKHDITGKFNFISQVIASISDDDFYKGHETETLLAIHNSILKMISTSRETLLNFDNNSTRLKVGSTAIENSSLINISDISLSYIFEKSQANYCLAYDPQDSNLIQKISLLVDVLPIKQIILDDSIETETAIKINLLKNLRGIL